MSTWLLIHTFILAYLSHSNHYTDDTLATRLLIIHAVLKSSTVIYLVRLTVCGLDEELMETVHGWLDSVQFYFLQCLDNVRWVTESSSRSSNIRYLFPLLALEVEQDD